MTARRVKICQFSLEPQSSAEVARKDGNRAGGIGRHRRHARQHQSREGQEGASSGDRVEHAGQAGSNYRHDKLYHHNPRPLMCVLWS